MPSYDLRNVGPIPDLVDFLPGELSQMSLLSQDLGQCRTPAL